jgi:hypothetical protein
MPPSLSFALPDKIGGEKLLDLKDSLDNTDQVRMISTGLLLYLKKFLKMKKSLIMNFVNLYLTCPVLKLH